MGKIVVGFDNGGVILSSANDKTDTSFFGDDFLKSVTEPDAFEVMKDIIAMAGSENAFIVSKCGKRIEERTLAYFEHHQLYERTGMLRKNVFFCRKREEKAPICKRLGITHFVDDRLTVHQHLSMVPHKILFRGHADEMRKLPEVLATTHRVTNWREIAKYIGV